MKVTSSLEQWPVHACRRLIAWGCRQLDLPVRYVKVAEFCNSRIAWSGRAYYRPRLIVVRVGSDDRFPCPTKRHNGGLQETVADPIEACVLLTAHELAHMMQFREGLMSRAGGKRRGGSERNTDWEAFRVLNLFRADRERLLAEWHAVPVVSVTPPRSSVVEQRSAKAQVMLANWQRRLKIAQTKVQKYKAKVRYYERKRSVPPSVAADKFPPAE